MRTKSRSWVTPGTNLTPLVPKSLPEDDATMTFGLRQKIKNVRKKMKYFYDYSALRAYLAAIIPR